jgi:fumarate reductase subunit C
METHFDVYGFWVIAIVFFVLTLIVVSLVVIHEMSETRGRNSLGWIILSFIINPLIVMFCLLCLGETEQKRRERLLKDEDYLRTWRNDD